MSNLAARVDDDHTCPIHTGGPILNPGAVTTRIEKHSAARLSDAAECVGATDYISSSSRTVVINKKPAARQTDTSVHGGKITGSAAKVFIGDQPRGPVFNPYLWNDYMPCGDPSFFPSSASYPDGAIQLSNNCYAYAVDDPFGNPYKSKPQPGNASGSPMTGMTVDEPKRASVADGLIPAPDPPVPKEGYYVVAGVVADGVDYHWYRQDADGKWSHKQGFCEAKTIDASGNPVTDPKTANRDYSGSGGANYSGFAGYFYVPNGGIDAQ